MAEARAGIFARFADGTRFRLGRGSEPVARFVPDFTPSVHSFRFVVHSNHGALRAGHRCVSGRAADPRVGRACVRGCATLRLGESYSCAADTLVTGKHTHRAPRSTPATPGEDRPDPWRPRRP